MEEKKLKHWGQEGLGNIEGGSTLLEKHRNLMLFENSMDINKHENI